MLLFVELVAPRIEMEILFFIVNKVFKTEKTKKRLQWIAGNVRRNKKN